jgi:hypothetical protein
MARKPQTSGGRFLQTKSGAVYHWSAALAKSRGSFEVDAQTAADYFRELGAENHITKAYPPRGELLAQARVVVPEVEIPVVETPPEPELPLVVAPPPKAVKSKKPPKKSKEPAGLVMSDKPMTPDEIQDLVNGDANG